MKGKFLKGNGEVDYDYSNDILFFKTSERDYARSMEFDNLVLDLDEENFVVGIQIFEASRFLNVSKTMLLKIPKWEFNAVVKDNKIEIRLTFQIKIRNKIIEKNPIIVQSVSTKLPDTKLICEVK